MQVIRACMERGMGSYAVMGQVSVCNDGNGLCGNSVPSTQFCCEPKAALKDKMYFKKLSRFTYVCLTWKFF